MSSGNDFSGPWNDGPSTQLGETFQFIEDPVQHVIDTNGLLDQVANGTDRTEQDVQKMDKMLSEERSAEVNLAAPPGEQQWNKEMVFQEKKSNEEKLSRNNGKKTTGKKGSKK
jgi:Mn-containing catalase